MNGKTIALAAVFILAAGGLAAWGMGAFATAKPAEMPAGAQQGWAASDVIKGGCCPGGGAMTDSAGKTKDMSAYMLAGASSAGDKSEGCPASSGNAAAASADFDGCPATKAADATTTAAATKAGCGDRAECGGSGCEGDSFEKASGDSCEKVCGDCPAGD